LSGNLLGGKDERLDFAARPATNNITLSWQPPRNQGIIVRGYTIAWGKGIPDEEVRDVESDQRTFVIDNLGKLSLPACL